MKPNIQKIKSAAPQKIGRILLWTLVVFLLLRGIETIFKEDEKEKAQTLIDTYIKNTELKSNLELQGKSFAESFALEYLTMSGRDSEGYIKRLNKYLQNDMDININAKSNIKTEAYIADGYRVIWTSDNSFYVDVKAKVKYFNLENSSTSVQALTQQTNLNDYYQINDVCLRIPIVEKDGSFEVGGYPAFIPGEDKANVERESYSGKEASEDTRKAVKDIMESFFKIYYAGNSGEISYYMLDSSKAQKGLEGRYEFVSIEEISVYLLDGENSNYVIVKVSVKDSVNGVIIPQEYKIELVKKEDKYYINKMDV